ncbi:hypothetical protein D3C85_1685740 [compost metagenome]
MAACAINSRPQDGLADEVGPVSEPMNSSAPCRLTRRDDAPMTRLERMVSVTSMARHSWVYSSTTVRHLIC